MPSNTCFCVPAGEVGAGFDAVFFGHSPYDVSCSGGLACAALGLLEWDTMPRVGVSHAFLDENDFCAPGHYGWDVNLILN